MISIDALLILFYNLERETVHIAEPMERQRDVIVMVSARCGVEVEDIYRTLNALLFMLILHYNIFGE